MTVNRSSAAPVPQASLRLTRDALAEWLGQENARLMAENARLRQQCADLAASAELWIHLYEEALRRVR